MKNWKGMVLIITSIIATTMLLGQLWLGSSIQKAQMKNMQAQARFNNARQADQVFRQLVVRMAVLADKDQQVKALMNKYNLQATITVDGVQKRVP